MKKIYLLGLIAIIFPLLNHAQVSILLSSSGTKGGIVIGTHVLFANNLPNSVGQVGVTDGTAANTFLLPTSTAYLDLSTKIYANSFLSKLFVNLTEPTHGKELWTADGTIGGFQLLKDINPGAASSNLYGNANGEGFPTTSHLLFFAADDGVHGSELWKTDGTLAGTSLVKDINPGVAGSSINFGRDAGYNYIGDTLYFLANDGVHGQELWKTDGTSGGTLIVADISPGATSTSFGESFIALGNKLYFLANDNVNGAELWVTDGTAAGTLLLKDINPGSGSSFNINNNGINALIFNNTLYFVADSRNLPGNNNPQLYKTDGTAQGTIALTNLNPNFGGLNASLYNGSNNTAVILKGKFYFPVFYGTQSASAIWSSDGTAANTQLFKSIYPNPGPAGNNNLYLNLILPNYPGKNKIMQRGFHDNSFFFIANDPTHGLQLWNSDGTVPNTKMITLNSSGNGIDTTQYAQGFFNSLYFAENNIFFSATDGTHGNELWKSDGTQAGTKMIKDINPGAGSCNCSVIGLASGTTLVFDAFDGTNSNLYRLDTITTPLPITLVDITAQFSDKAILLEWKTLQESNTSHFNIQRSKDGNNFTTIATVSAAGNSSTVKLYNYIDADINEPLITFYYYRLQIVDLNANAYYSKIVSSKVQHSNVFKILPNPVVNNLIVKFDETVTGNALIKVVNSAGQIVLQQVQKNITDQSIVVPLNNLGAGTYFIEVQAGSKKYSKTIVKF